MDVENAKILSIGEEVTTKSGIKMRNIVLQLPLGEKKTFVIYENKRSPDFDLIRKFERGVFKPDQSVSFNYNKASTDWQFDSIWKLTVNHARREGPDTGAPAANG